MVVRLMSRHLGDQKFEVVGHALLHTSHSERCRNERSSRPRILYIHAVEQVACRQPTEKDDR